MGCKGRPTETRVTVADPPSLTVRTPSPRPQHLSTSTDSQVSGKHLTNDRVHLNKLELTLYRLQFSNDSRIIQRIKCVRQIDNSEMKNPQNKPVIKTGITVLWYLLNTSRSCQGLDLNRNPTIKPVGLWLPPKTQVHIGRVHTQLWY